MTNINVSDSDRDISEVLVQSFLLLRRRPKLFIPKIASTILGALWFLGLVEGAGDVVYYLISLPLLTFTGFFVSVMVAGMVKESGSDRILRRGFGVAVSNFEPVIYSTLLLLAATLLMSIPLSIGLYYYIAFGETIILAFGALATLAMTLTASFLLYFYPISLIEHKSVFKGLKSSKTAAVSNSREVVLLTFVSFTLIVFAAASQDYLKALGYIGFIAGRLTSAVVTTYLFVVSPRYYLEQ